MCQAIIVRLLEWGIFHHLYCPFKNSYPARLDIRELIIHNVARNKEASSEESSRTVDEDCTLVHIQYM